MDLTDYLKMEREKKSSTTTKKPKVTKEPKQKSESTPTVEVKKDNNHFENKKALDSEAKEKFKSIVTTSEDPFKTLKVDVPNTISNLKNQILPDTFSFDRVQNTTGKSEKILKFTPNINIVYDKPELLEARKQFKDEKQDVIDAKIIAETMPGKSGTIYKENAIKNFNDKWDVNGKVFSKNLNKVKVDALISNDSNNIYDLNNSFMAKKSSVSVWADKSTTLKNAPYLLSRNSINGEEKIKDDFIVRRASTPMYDAITKFKINKHDPNIYGTFKSHGNVELFSKGNDPIKVDEGMYNAVFNNNLEFQLPRWRTNFKYSEKPKSIENIQYTPYLRDMERRTKIMYDASNPGRDGFGKQMNKEKITPNVEFTQTIPQFPFLDGEKKPLTIDPNASINTYNPRNNIEVNVNLPEELKNKNKELQHQISLYERVLDLSNRSDVETGSTFYKDRVAEDEAIVEQPYKDVIWGTGEKNKLDGRLGKRQFGINQLMDRGYGLQEAATIMDNDAIQAKQNKPIILQELVHGTSGMDVDEVLPTSQRQNQMFHDAMKELITEGLIKDPNNTYKINGWLQPIKGKSHKNALSKGGTGLLKNMAKGGEENFNKVSPLEALNSAASKIAKGDDYVSKVFNEDLITNELTEEEENTLRTFRDNTYSIGDSVKVKDALKKLLSQSIVTKQTRNWVDKEGHTISEPYQFPIDISEQEINSALEEYGYRLQPGLKFESLFKEQRQELDPTFFQTPYVKSLIGNIANRKDVTALWKPKQAKTKVFGNPDIETIDAVRKAWWDENNNIPSELMYSTSNTPIYNRSIDYRNSKMNTNPLLDNTSYEFNKENFINSLKLSKSKEPEVKEQSDAAKKIISEMGKYMPRGSSFENLHNIRKYLGSTDEEIAEASRIYGENMMKEESGKHWRLTSQDLIELVKDINDKSITATTPQEKDRITEARGYLKKTLGINDETLNKMINNPLSKKVVNGKDYLIIGGDKFEGDVSLDIVEKLIAGKDKEYGKALWLSPGVDLKSAMKIKSKRATPEEIASKKYERENAIDVEENETIDEMQKQLFEVTKDEVLSEEPEPTKKGKKGKNIQDKIDDELRGE